MPEFADFAQQFTLARDALGQGKAALTEGMAAPRFGEALDQRFVLGFQKQQPYVHTLFF
jgi:hypothetical protein